MQAANRLPLWAWHQLLSEALAESRRRTGSNDTLPALLIVSPGNGADLPAALNAGHWTLWPARRLLALADADLLTAQGWPPATVAAVQSFVAAIRSAQAGDTGPIAALVQARVAGDIACPVLALPSADHGQF